ncbi:MAG: alanine--tRNA ligase [Verrucomicrobia bacterium]|nr:alanine--tRNA ligase [Verrucomicrobiota bacterium]
MTSSQIRQSFLDFFKSKQHTIVPSSSLMPDSPNLLFTNAGMNQFVPIFLGQAQCPYAPGRAADTQKCIRAGGKHNDLEDVGLDTYHHTFFEMLGNWSFGDYFKKEAIEWAWELVTGVWKFPKDRLYATVYQPGSGEPSEFDQEAYDHWARLFNAAGLDPKVHICFGGKKDNFWMMGETGPCGPCSELHVDLTPFGDTKGALVNQGSPKCIEIWNLVFMQYNANPDGTFTPLPAKSVDTGMGFERVAGIMQNTRHFSDFTRVISNYETDIFRPIFEKLETLSGKKYQSSLPKPGTPGQTEQEKMDVAFRVVADHIRTLSFSIADFIQPGNNDRNYVLRRILRRAVRYGRVLGLHEPFFFKLVDVLAETMGDVFPEIRARKDLVKDTIYTEEEAFNKTLDRGIARFEEMHARHIAQASEIARSGNAPALVSFRPNEFIGEYAFELYDTYGFPLDLTELMARERGLTVDVEGFNRLMEEQRARARAAQKKTVIELSQIETSRPTNFVGYDTLETPAKVLEVVSLKDKTAVILDTSCCYAEMGGQVGDTGTLFLAAEGSSGLASVAAGTLAVRSRAVPEVRWRVANTQKSGNTWLHLLEGEDAPTAGDEVLLEVEAERRRAIQRHHTATHLLHWAIHEVVSKEAAQKGSAVDPKKFTFDFNANPLTTEQVADVERLVNERIVENAPVTWQEVKYDHVKRREDIMQFFGDKYGEWVRVVQIGGQPTALDGYSMELCGGTHTRATGEIGLFRIVSEGTIAAGTRRIEAVCGLEAYGRAAQELQLIRTLAGKVNSPIVELEKKIETLVEQQKALERQLRAVQQKEAAGAARGLVSRAETINGVPAIIENMGALDGDTLQGMVNELKSLFKGVIVLGGAANNAVALIASVSPEFTARIQAGKIIQQICPVVGGKGGGKPDFARGGGKEASKLNEALGKAKQLLGP